MKRKRILSLVLATSIALTPISSLAHSGRTDGNGGHRDNKNVSGLGSYHYHCRGYPPHLHKNGCPYNGKAKTKSSSSKSSTSKNNNTKKVQEKLNSLGYNCGKADGILGKGTKNAIKSFQKDKGLTADGIAGKKTLSALGL